MRRLLAAGAPPPAQSSLDAQRAHLERALGVITTVLFVASLSYIALSTLYGCLCAGRRPREAAAGDSGASPPAAAEVTKRVLEEIPVVVVQVRRGHNGGRNDRGRGAEHGEEEEEEEEEEAGECAVCLAEYAGGDEVRVLPSCRHGFHRECVDRWLITRAPTCPVCRASVAAPLEGTGAKRCDAVLHVGS